MHPVIVIPVRMASTRLPEKPMAVIGGEPMIAHVWRRGLEADLGPVLVAVDQPSVADVIFSLGGNAVMTDPALPSGSDRVAAAIRNFDPDRRHDVVINLQGDMPTADPATIQAAVRCLDLASFDLATLACPIRSGEELRRSAVVKVAMEALDKSGSFGRALYFSRAPVPHDAATFLRHIGLYVYRRPALERFVAAPSSGLERIERLEQLRALAIGISVGVAVIDSAPLSVDTDEDLARAQRMARLGCPPFGPAQPRHAPC